MITKIEAYHICEFLDKQFAAPAYLTLFEVRNGPGFRQQKRYADVVIFSMWPSNGLTITGVEIKVGRQDLKYELAHPEKSYAIKKYCDYWWLAHPVIMKVDDIEIPDDWGIMTFDSKGNRKLTKIAPRLQAQQLSRAFIFSFMRSASRRGLDKVERYIRRIR